MELLRSLKPQQLIDVYKVFNKDALTSIAKTLDCQKDYYSIAIIGVQNSGKSTLLNHLFGTNFDVLKKDMGTSTTKGVWASLDKTQNLIILDVEGNDSYETHTSKDREEFQKVISTFCLLFANVLIINVNERLLGQSSGSQYDTLNIMMEICLLQFRQESPKTILFCMRDFDKQNSSIEQMRVKIIQDVRNIWQKIEKPQEVKRYQKDHDRLFNIEIAFLRKYDEDYPQDFQEDVQQLRKKIIDINHKEYIFRRQKKQHNLPINDLPDLTSIVWEGLINNKKLNLPNQKIQLSNYRCSQILEKCNSQLDHQIQELGQLPDLGAFYKKTLEWFKKQTYSYGKQVVAQKEKELVEKIHQKFISRINEVCDARSKKLEDQFIYEIGHLNYNPTTSFLKETKEIYLKSINEQTKDFQILNYEIPKRAQKIKILTGKLQNILKEESQKRQKQLHHNYRLQVDRQISMLAAECIKNYFNVQFWTDTSSHYKIAHNKLIDQYKNKLYWIRGSELSPNEYDEEDIYIFKKSKEEIKKELQNSMLNKLVAYFQKNFKFDQNDLPRNFLLKSEEEVQQIFQEAKRMTINLLNIIDMIKISEDRRSSIIDEEMSFNSSGENCFNAAWLITTKEELQNRIKIEYETIIRKKKQAKMKNIPWYMILIVLFFAYDDLWFSASEYPIIHHILLYTLILCAFFIAIGQGDFIHQFAHYIGDSLSNATSGTVRNVSNYRQKLKQAADRASQSPQKSNDKKRQ